MRGVEVLWRCEVLLLFWVGLLASQLPAGAEAFQLITSWTLSPGSRPYLTTSGTLERGVAYNPLTDHVLVVSRSDSSTVRRISILSGETGQDLGELRTNGISGGTLVLSKIGVADDGAIYGANFGTYGSGNPIKIYRWANETSTPTLAFSGDPGSGTPEQWGNCMAVRGTGARTQILLGSRGTILSLLTTGNGTTFNSTVLSSDAPAGAFYHSVAFDRGNTFWAKTNTGPLRSMEFDPSAKTATTRLTLNSPSFSAAAQIAVDPVNRLLASLDIGNGHAVSLFDLGSGSPVLNHSIPIPEALPNSLFQGGLDFYFNGRLFALDSNNGLRACRVLPPSRLRTDLASGLIHVYWTRRLTNAVLQTRSSLDPGAVWTPRKSAQPVSNELMDSFSRAGPGAFYSLRRTFKVMTYNIHHAESTDGTINISAIAAVIQTAAPDIVGLQEVDRLALRSGYVDQAAELARLTGMNFFFGRNKGIDIGDYGIAVLSRFPIRRQTHVLLNKQDSSVEQRGVNILTIDVGGSEFTLLNTHLDAGSDHAERLFEVSQIKQLAAAQPTGPLIICGDFNAIPASSPYNQMIADFTDAWPLLGAGNGYTFPSTGVTKRIDYLWVRPNQVVPFRGSIPYSSASDHLALNVEWLVP